MRMSPLGTGADEQEGDVRLIAQPVGSVEDVAEGVCHAVGADIADDEPAAKAPRLRQGLVARSRAVAGEIDTIRDHGNLLCSNATGDQVLLEPGGERHDRSSTAVEMELKLFEQHQRQGASHRADAGNRRRPQVGELEHERHSPQCADPAAGGGGQELRRVADNHVGTRFEQCAGETAHPETEEVE